MKISVSADTRCSMADLHPLDIAYESYWLHPMNHPPLDNLFAEVLRHARRLCRDDDASQDATLYIFDHLDTFRRRDAHSFSRWVMAVCRRRRHTAVRRLISGRSDVELIEDTLPVDDEGRATRDYNSLPLPIRAVAFCLANGMTLEDLAKQLGVTKGAVRKKVERHCRKTTTVKPV